MTAIKITCRTADVLPIESMTELQGELKSLSEENYTRLRNQIEQEGFCAAVHIWRDQNGTNYILDGTQRTRVVRSMVEQGYFCPPLPVVYVEAASPKEAMRKLLGMAGDYGKAEKDGLFECMHIAEISFEEFDEKFNFHTINHEKFELEFGDAEPPPEEPKEPKSVTCPYCLNTFTKT